MSNDSGKLLLSSEDGLVRLYQDGNRMWIDVYPTAHTRCRTLSDGVVEVAPLVSEFRVIASEFARQVPEMGLSLTCTAEDKPAHHRRYWQKQQASRLKRYKGYRRTH